MLNCHSLAHPLRIRCPHCKKLALCLKPHPLGGQMCAICIDELSGPGGLRPAGRSASKRDPELDFDDLNMPDDDRIGVRD